MTQSKKFFPYILSKNILLRTLTFSSHLTLTTFHFIISEFQTHIFHIFYKIFIINVRACIHTKIVMHICIFYLFIIVTIIIFLFFCQIKRYLCFEICHGEFLPQQCPSHSGLPQPLHTASGLISYYKILHKIIILYTVT